MNRFYKVKFSLLLMLLGLAMGHSSYAEGSKDLYPGGIGGGRAFLVSTTGTKTGWTLTNRGVHYAYLKVGETLGAASSAQGIGSGQIILTAPDGTVYSSTVGDASVGKIATRTEEVQGPWVGYTPFSRVVGAGQAGIWKIELLSTNPPATINESAGANAAANAAWVQDPASSAIAAWDVSVRDASNNFIPGRVYTNVLNMYVQAGDYRGIIYVLTKDGYVYKVNNNGSSGLGFVAFVNNKGLTATAADNGAPLYKSLAGTNIGTNFNTWDPRADDGTFSITHKMFYHVPANDLPVSSTMSGGKLIWLKVPKIIPTVTDISVDGVEGTSGQVSKKGAFIKFTASTSGTYRITLEGTGSFIPKQITGTASEGPNSVFWDGRDGANVAPTLGSASITAKIQLQGAEVHFPFIDVEQNPNGLVIEQLNDDNSVKTDIVYWDDSNFPSVPEASNPRFNGNTGNGLSSNANGHKWLNSYGDNRTMDTWTYILGDMATKNTTLNIVEADLAIPSVGPVPVTTQVYAGKQITYNVTVVNNGPSDVKDAPFAINVPAGFTIADLSAVTSNTSCGTVKSISLDASGNYHALLDLPNGCIITFSVTGTVSAALAGGNINVEATIMRPKDVTDPDATNPDASVPPTDPYLECKNGGTVPNCNNIRSNNNVAVLASADIVVAKRLQDPSKTTYSKGESVNYIFTVKNDGPSTATNVHVTDAAPSGTTIGAWTASVTAGVVNLPAVTGSGNIDQTITNMPAGAEVTYVVQIDLPAAYNLSLSNTANATSTVHDETAGNNTSTTAPITLELGADIVTVKQTKTAGQTTYTPGDNVIYTITVTNNGPGEAKGVNIKDVAPAGTSISGWTASVTSGVVTLASTSGTGDLDETIATMPNGAVVTYEVTVSVPASQTGDLSNTATVTTTSRDDVPGNNDSTTPALTVSPVADVAVTKSTAALTYVPGKEVTYTITVTNNGPSDAKDVRIEDTAPIGTSISSWSAVVTTGAVTLDGSSGVGNIDQIIALLPDGAVVTYTVNIAVPSGFNDALSNTASVSSATPDNTPGNNTSTTTGINPLPEADVVVKKTTSLSNYVPGQNVLYSVVVTNDGPSDAKNVRIRDIAPTGSIVWSAVVTAGTVTLPANSGIGDLDQTIATLPSGAIVTYAVIVRVPSSFTDPLINTATVATATPDTDNTNNSSTTDPITALPEADVTIAKTTTAVNFVPGDEVTYTIVVTNNGASDAHDVNVKDVAPIGTSISAWTAVVTSGTVTLPNTSGTDDLNETIATLPYPSEVTYTVNVKVPSDRTANLSNTATVGSTTPDNDNTNNTTTTTDITPAPKADIAVVKSTTATTFAPGEEVTYTITITNNGPSDAQHVNVKDVAPTGTNISGWTASVTAGTVTLPNTSGTGDLNETIAKMPNGAVVTYTVTVKTPADFNSALINSTNATSDATDDTPGNNTSVTTGIMPIAKANVAVVKTAAQATYVPGKEAVYTITVTNSGPSDAKNVRVEDTAPTGTSISSWSAVVTTGTVTLPSGSGSGNLDQTINTLPNGAVVTYTVNVAVPASFTDALSNTATVTSPTDNTGGNNTSTTTGSNPLPEADVAVVKQTSASAYVPGENVLYTVVVTNNGPSDAKNVRIRDVAPTGSIAWVATVTAGTVTLPANSGTGDLDQTIATMPNGAIVTYGVVVRVPSSFTDPLVNTATVSSTTTDPAAANNSSTAATLNPLPEADVKVVKKSTQADFVPGNEVAYTITVTNDGPSDAHDVNVKDVAPTGTTISSWTAAVTSGTVTLPNASGTGDLNETIATLPYPAEVTYTVMVKVPADRTANLKNTAIVSSTTPDNTNTNNTSTTTDITPVTKADIAVVKTAAQTTYVPGKDAIYTITVTNSGPSDAKNVNVKDVAPTGTAISAWSAVVTTGTVTLANTSGTGNINEIINNLPDGAVVTYTVTVHTPASMTANLVNTATVTSTTTDETPANNSSTATALIPAPEADLVLAKTTTQTIFVPGKAVVYTITITNNGPSDAKNVKVQDLAPTGTSIGSWTASVTTGTVTLPHTSGTGDLNETIANLPDGATVTYVVSVDVPSGFTGNLSNSASASSDATDKTPGSNNSTTTAIAPVPEADLLLVKSTKDGAQKNYTPGGSVVYTITVTNNGPSDAANVNIKDVAPAGTTIGAWSARATNGTVTLPHTSGTGNLDETIVSLPDGATVVYEVTVMIPSGFTGTLSNSATVKSTTHDATPGNNTGITTGLTPVVVANLVTVKTLKNAAQTTFVAGDEVAYVITVTNNGPGDATNVNVKDVAPAGTTISSWTAAVKTGTVTLPHISGTGNLDETVAVLPNAAAVTYEVTVKTPEDYKGTLVNVAAVTSDANDPVPDCPACTAPAATAEPLPVAEVDNQGNVKANLPVTIPVLNNDTPGDVNTPLDPSSLEIVQQPAHGSLVVNEDGTIVYTPETGYTGPDSFTYKVKDEHGSWSNVATVNLTIVANEVEVPNVITPNGDGSNDKLVIKGLEKFIQNEIVIYNRWNNVLYRKQNYQGEWDGQGLNAGTYYYTLKGLDANGQWQTYNGYIMLLR